MSRRLLLLNGLAILAVVCNHAAAWGETAMFWWTDCYRPVETPNYDQRGTWAYWALVAIIHLAMVSVPAFLFISGFFVSYAARSQDRTASWRMTRTRIIHLLVPYVIWSAVIYLGDSLQGVTYSPLEYLTRLLTGGATATFFYVPVLVQLLLVSPLLAPPARAKPGLLLTVSALVQSSAMGVRYARFLGADAPRLALVWTLVPSAYFVFFFSFGMVAGSHLSELKRLVARYRWPLAGAVVSFAALAIVEGEATTRVIGWRFGGPATLSGAFYALCFILCFLGFDLSSMLPSRTLYYLGRNSFGIYLLHCTLLELFARVIRQVAPWILAHQVTLFVPLLVALGIGVPLLSMSIVAKSPMRRVYRYLFG